LLDIFEAHFAELVGEQLAENKLAVGAGIGARAVNGGGVDLDVAEEAAEEAGVVEHRRVQGSGFRVQGKIGDR
jgi:hypothetical protein